MRTSHSILILLLLDCTIVHAQFNWTHTDGPFGSLASSIFANDDYAFVPAGDFLFRSPDGEHWEKIVHPVSDIMATWKDTVASLVINAGTLKTELHISTDQGLNWSIHDVPQKVNEYDAGLSLCRSSVNIPLIGKNIMYRSTDLGVTWDTTAYPGQFSTGITTQDNRFYLLREDGIKRSDADGNNWSAVIAPPFSSYEESYAMAAVDDSILLFASDDRIWYTHDGGTTWSFQNIYPSNSYVNITIAGQGVFVQTPNHLLRSEDFGVTWDTLHQFNYEFSYSSAALRNTYLYSTWNKGIYRWDQNAGSVVQSNHGIGFGYIYELALGQDQIWAACANGLYAYDLQTKSWSDRMDIPEFDDKPVFVSANDDGWVVTSGLSGDFYFSEDKGQTWTAVLPNSFSLSGLGRDRVELLGHTMIALTPNGVMRSVDKGLNWDWLTVFYVNTEIVHAHNQYYMASFDSLYYSGDDGLTWKARSLPFNIEELGAYKDDLYVISSENHTNKLYVSPNGLDWNPGGPGHYNRFLGYTPYYYHNTYFRDEDYYYSFEGGGSQYATSIYDLTSSEVQMSYGNDYVVLDSVIYKGSRGMYVSTIEHPFVTATKEITNTATQIFSINPNPVSDFIQITIHPDWREEGQIKIYSSDGTLHYSGVVMPGENQINIAMKDFPSALYHVVFITRDREESHSCLKL